MRAIELFNETRTLRVDKKKLQLLIAALDALHKPFSSGPISLALVSHQRLAAMHAQFCGDPTPTDVITFPGQEDSFGELCISPQAAREYVRLHGGTFDSEMRRYVIHGYLHLIGYDDITSAKRARMKKEEARLLRATATIKTIFSSRA